MIPDEEVERVRDAADIVAIISEYVPLKRTGADFRGQCPFHQGKDRNFSVSARRRICHCFVCGEGGDVFTFLRKRLGVDWPTAVRIAAEKSGLELREVNVRREGPDPREAIWEVNNAAQDYFRRLLWDDAVGEAAREYVANREVSRQIADRFGLGFAPRDQGLLRAYLGGLGFDEARQMAAGLLVQHEDAKEPRARFRGRLMFPIYEVGGSVAGFGGRLIAAGEPKYLNSADSIAFTKGKLLYGLNWARNAIRRAERALVVEGYFDLLRLVVAGIEEVVAPLGTALTSDQAVLITRYSKNIFLLYDSDRAGLRATFRAGDELLRQGASVRVVSLPEGEDPDTFVRRQGRDALERHLGVGIDVLERKIQVLQRGGWFSDLHRRRRAIDHLLPTIRAAADPVMRDLYVARAAEASGVDRRVLDQEAAGAEPGTPSRRAVRRHADNVPPGTPAPRPRAPQRTRTATRPLGGSVVERDLLRAMLSVRSVVERVGERVGPEEFRDPRFREIFEVLTDLGADASNTDVAASLTAEAAEALEVLLGEPDAIQDVERTVNDCIAGLERRKLQERNAEIQRLMTAATETEKNQLVAEKQANVAEIRRLSQSGYPA